MDDFESCVSNEEKKNSFHRIEIGILRTYLEFWFLQFRD